ncbi:MAG: hypothetical protein HY554_10705 [Elusimicrobia bacterium]|nr:hypothetical protein [Elusimicrobiota bacterium]
MRKLLALLFLVGLGAGGVYLVREGQVDLPAGLGSKATGDLKRKSFRFLECLKFKDFKCASLFHTTEDLKANPEIPKLLEDFFLIPPESLDVQDIVIDFVEFDSTDSRAKVKVTTTVNILNKKETRKPEVMLYWKRVGEAWYLDLRTTLERRRMVPL